jgi:hypothetical protein
VLQEWEAGWPGVEQFDAALVQTPANHACLQAKTVGLLAWNVAMSTKVKSAKKWTCEGCGVSVSQIGGEKVELPATWVSGQEGTYCLNCRRERAAQAALDAAPDTSTVDERAKLRRAALIEFEVSRRPDHGDGVIAKACRSSVSAVAAARRRLKLPAPTHSR